MLAFLRRLLSPAALVRGGEAAVQAQIADGILAASISALFLSGSFVLAVVCLAVALTLWALCRFRFGTRVLGRNSEGQEMRGRLYLVPKRVWRVRLYRAATSFVLLTALIVLAGGLLEKLEDRRAMDAMRGAVAATKEGNDRIEERLDELEGLFDRERRYIIALAKVFVEQQARLKGGADSESLFEHALAQVASDEGIAVEDLQSTIQLFIAAVKEAPQAEQWDLALVAFAERDFGRAAEIAGRAAELARERRLAARAAQARMATAEEAARREEIDARILEARASFAERRFDAAVGAFKAARELSLPAEDTLRSQLSADIGQALEMWASVSAGDAIRDLRDRAIEAYEEALESDGIDRAAVRVKLAKSLAGRAESEAGTERRAFLNRARASLETALAETSPDDDAPETWALAETGLCSVLVGLAAVESGAERVALLNKALMAGEDALGVFVRDEFPYEWALATTSVAIARYECCETYRGSRRLDALERVVRECEGALGVLDAKMWPSEWAQLQHNLGVSLRILANESPATEERSNRLGRSLAAFGAALTVRKRTSEPQGWAASQKEKADVLDDLAEDAPPNERKRLLEDAREAIEAALEVYRLDDLPQAWANAKISQALILRSLGELETSNRGKTLVSESRSALDEVIDEFPRDLAPKLWATAQFNLAITLYALAQASPEADRMVLYQAMCDAAEASLEVRTRAEAPLDWATSMRSVGDGIGAMADLLEGWEEAEALLTSADIYRQALEEFDRVTTESAWSEVQYMRGWMLVRAARLVPNPDQGRLAADAVPAFRAALTVFDPVKRPEEWRKAKNNLAVALGIQSDSVTGSERLDLLLQARDALEASLTVDAPGPAEEELQRWRDKLDADIESLSE